MTKRPKCKTRGCSHRAAAKPSIKAYGYCGGCAEADTTRREWEVRAATSYADGRKAGLREAAGVCHAIKQENGDDPRVWLVDYMEECEQRILALAPPAAETVKGGA